MNIKIKHTEDELYFDQLYLLYHPKLTHFLVSLLHDDELSRDMAQDIFIKLWEKRNNLESIDNISAYIYRMAKNSVFNHFKHIKIETRYQINELIVSQFDQSTEESVFANDLQELISYHIECMPKQRAKIFKMSRIEGLDNGEIAHQLNIDKRTVENHITNALRDLRKVMMAISMFII